MSRPPRAEAAEPLLESDMPTLDGVATAAVPVRHSWVAGHEVAGAGGFEPAIDPATGQAFAEVSLLDPAQAGDSLARARAAFDSWSASSFEARGRHLLALRQALLDEADEVSRLIAREQGKPAAEALAVEIMPALEALKHLALHAEDDLRDEEVDSALLLFAHKRGRLVYTPLGVILVVTPWNYPLGLPLIGVATALAAGNTVVLKPAPATRLVGLKIGELCTKAGLPDGVVSVVAVDDRGAAALVEDPRVAKIVFTGSVETGRKVMAAAAKNLTPVVLELGGKDPAVVCADADLGRAARGIVWGAFVNTGQTCASVERVYVAREVAEPFLARVVEETKRLRVGSPAEPDTDLGPLTLERQRRIVEDHVADARARGAAVLTGGEPATGPGFFYPPTVLTGVDHTMRIMREETFGPVLPVMAVDSLEEAVRLANDGPYGLTASVWTRDEATGRRLAGAIQAGVVSINDCVSTFGEPVAPWGGVKWSGIGRTHGRAGLREMTQVRYVSEDWTRKPAIWWYPYDEAYRRFLLTAVRALHAGSFFTRVRHQIGLLAFSRLWRRLSLRTLVRGLDKLF
jgi:succinate-semialdehyde dehydrogenase/glutarate-semialdehyde dehydrogenase